MESEVFLEWTDYSWTCFGMFWCLCDRFDRSKTLTGLAPLTWYKKHHQVAWFRRYVSTLDFRQKEGANPSRGSIQIANQRRANIGRKGRSNVGLTLVNVLPTYLLTFLPSFDWLIWVKMFDLHQHGMGYVRCPCYGHGIGPLWLFLLACLSH